MKIVIERIPNEGGTYDKTEASCTTAYGALDAAWEFAKYTGATRLKVTEVADNGELVPIGLVQRELVD